MPNRDAERRRNLVVSQTADLLAYDVALIDACESLAIPHQLADGIGPAQRRRLSAVRRWPATQRRDSDIRP
jgi:hypothetical protein